MMQRNIDKNITLLRKSIILCCSVIRDGISKQKHKFLCNTYYIEFCEEKYIKMFNTLILIIIRCTLGMY